METAGGDCGRQRQGLAGVWGGKHGWPGRGRGSDWRHLAGPMDGNSAVLIFCRPNENSMAASIHAGLRHRNTCQDSTETVSGFAMLFCYFHLYELTPPPVLPMANRLLSSLSTDFKSQPASIAAPFIAFPCSFPFLSLCLMYKSCNGVPPQSLFFPPTKSRNAKLLSGLFLHQQ